jgi:hypothetical protein
MNLVDIFHFQDGRTVFAGSIKGHEEIIWNCQVELIIDEKVQKIITIQGEMIPNKRHPTGYRAISTSESIDFTSEFIKIYLKNLWELDY